MTCNTVYKAVMYQFEISVLFQHSRQITLTLEYKFQIKKKCDKTSRKKNNKVDRDIIKKRKEEAIKATGENITKIKYGILNHENKYTITLNMNFSLLVSLFYHKRTLCRISHVMSIEFNFSVTFHLVGLNNNKSEKREVKTKQKWTSFVTNQR